MQMITQRILVTSDSVKTEFELCCTSLFKGFRVTSCNPVRINMEGHTIYNSTEKELLGVKIDPQLLSESHVSILCKKLVKR